MLDGRTAGKSFAAAEGRQQRLVGPARAGEVSPDGEIVTVTTDMRHGMQAARSANDPSAWPVMHPAVRSGLRNSPVVPVIVATGEKRPLQRIGDVRIVRLAARFDERNRERGVFGKPRRC